MVLTVVNEYTVFICVQPMLKLFFFSDKLNKVVNTFSIELSESTNVSARLRFKQNDITLRPYTISQISIEPGENLIMTSISPWSSRNFLSIGLLCCRLIRLRLIVKRSNFQQTKRATTGSLLLLHAVLLCSALHVNNVTENYSFHSIVVPLLSVLYLIRFKF